MLPGLLALSACAATMPTSSGSGCRTFGAELPFDPDQYRADGVTPGSATEFKLQRLNEIWRVECTRLDSPWALQAALPAAQ